MTSRIHFLNFKVTSELNYYVRTLHCLSRPCFLRIPFFDSPEVILNKISFFFLMTTPSFSSRSVCQPASPPVQVDLNLGHRIGCKHSFYCRIQSCHIHSSTSNQLRAYSAVFIREKRSSRVPNTQFLVYDIP